MPEQQLRLPWIDALRGLAIILMVPANLSPYFVEPHPMWFRILGSFAAPMFIMVSAGMIVLRGDRHNLAYYLKRGGIVLSIGVLLDMLLWQIFPFTSFDVLYPIGLAMPLLYLLRRTDTRELLNISVIIILATYVLQALFGYHEEVLEIYFTEPWLPGIGRLLQSCFIDGWFPLFPWLGYAFIGALFYRTMFGEGVANSRHFLTLAIALTALGFALLFVPLPFIRNIADGSILASRGGYSEVFYPPTFAYVFASIGVVLLLSTLLRRLRFNPGHALLAFYGRYAMMVYILHQVIGVWLIEPAIAAAGSETISSGPLFTAVNLLTLALIGGSCYAIELLKRRRQPRSLLARVLFGR